MEEAIEEDNINGIEYIRTEFVGHQKTQTEVLFNKLHQIVEDNRLTDIDDEDDAKDTIIDIISDLQELSNHFILPVNDGVSYNYE